MSYGYIQGECEGENYRFRVESKVLLLIMILEYLMGRVKWNLWFRFLNFLMVYGICEGFGILFELKFNKLVYQYFVDVDRRYEVFVLEMKDFIFQDKVVV